MAPEPTYEDEKADALRRSIEREKADLEAEQREEVEVRRAPRRGEVFSKPRRPVVPPVVPSPAVMRRPGRR